MLARVIDEYAPHQLGGNAEEMGAILPSGVSLIDELQIRLVDERGWLQRVTGTFAAQIVTRETAQFVVNQRHQFLERRLVAVAPIDEQLGYAFGGLHSWAKWAKFYRFAAREGIRDEPPR